MGIVHSRRRVDEVLELASKGLNAGEVARRVGAPRATVRDWMTGATRRARDDGRLRCERCDREHQGADEVAEQYAYLLGLYLGDGCLSEHPRAVYKLRIVLDRKYPAIIEECAAAIAAVAPRVSVKA